MNRENSLETIASVIAFDSRDWSADFQSALIYGIVFGWEPEAVDEIQKKFRWSDDFVQQLTKLREDYQQRMESKKGESENATQTRI